MDNENLPIKEILVAVSPIIKSIVDTFISPKLERLKNGINMAFNKDWIPTEEHFLEYFHRTYKKVSIVNTLVFNNSQQLLKDIYIPLSIARRHGNEKKLKLTGYPKHFLDDFEKILITDTAGMGKSTLMKVFFLDIIDSRVGIPVLVELRRLNQTKSILKEIHEQISAIDKEFDSQLLLELIKDGGFIFILDGFDEVSINDREIVTSDLQSFISKAGNNKFILTSRPEHALKSFGDFENYTIEPLTKNEAFELLRKYDRQGDISALLIKKLQEKEMSDVEEFLTNPLLVSLLFTAFQHKQAIPFKKYLFYRQVYDANFEMHDLTKGDSYSHNKYSKLEIDDFHRILRHIGFTSFKKQKLEFDKDELLALIRESRLFCVGLNFKDSDFFKDLLVTVPLFTEDGTYYRWAHKSLQEYFAAQFIYLDTKDKQSDIILQIYRHKDLEKFLNVLDLYYDMDFKLFRNVILFDLLNEYKLFFNGYLKEVDSSISNDLIVTRKELCFLSRPILSSVDGEEIDHEKLNKLIDRLLLDNEGKFNLSGYVHKYIETGGIQCFFQEDPKVNLLKILTSKKSNLLKKVKWSKKEDRFTSMKPYFERSYEPIYPDDNPESPFNKYPIFKTTNEIITASRIRGIVIDSEKAFKMLLEIENDFQTYSSSDLFSI